MWLWAQVGAGEEAEAGDRPDGLGGFPLAIPPRGWASLQPVQGVLAPQGGGLQQKDPQGCGDGPPLWCFEGAGPRNGSQGGGGGPLLQEPNLQEKVGGWATFPSADKALPLGPPSKGEVPGGCIAPWTCDSEQMFNRIRKKVNICLPGGEALLLVPG